MGRILLSDGGEYHRPGRPHLFSPGLRAAAHFLKAVDKVNRDVRKQLVEVGKTHYLPSLKRGQNGSCATPDLCTTTPEGPQREKELEMGRQFLEAIQHWLDGHHLASPFVFDLAYRTLQLWMDIRGDRQDLESRIANWKADPEPLTEAERGVLEKDRDRVKFLTDELDGWGWWVDFLASDLSIPQLEAWFRDGSTATERHRKLFQRMELLRVEIVWEPPVNAPPFRLILEGWRPEEETWAAAKARFEKGFKEVLGNYRRDMGQALRSGQLHPRPKDSKRVNWGEPHRWDTAPTKYGDEHFGWLALRQVKGLRPQEIADRPGIRRTVSTVNEALEGTARLLQMELRPVRPGPPSVLGD